MRGEVEVRRLAVGLRVCRCVLCVGFVRVGPGARLLKTKRGAAAAAPRGSLRRSPAGLRPAQLKKTNSRDLALSPQ
jgi:hypothetical protein